MIYDPTRRALELKRNIMRTMSAEELDEYGQRSKQHDAEPVVIRQCENCGEDRLLFVQPDGSGECASCGCGCAPLDAKDLAALENRGP